MDFIFFRSYDNFSEASLPVFWRKREKNSKKEKNKQKQENKGNGKNFYRLILNKEWLILDRIWLGRYV